MCCVIGTAGFASLASIFESVKWGASLPTSASTQVEWCEEQRAQMGLGGELSEAGSNSSWLSLSPVPIPRGR